MGFRVNARLQGNTIKEINRLIEQGAVEPANRVTAKAMARVARNNFRRKTQRLGTGETLRDIRAKKSEYSDTGWIFGVLGESGGGRGSTRWTKTTGARALFFEYGRSAPGRGRDRGLRIKADPRSQRAQPPRPFMRPTISEGRRRLFGTTSKEIKRTLRKVRRGKVPKKVLRKIA